MTKLVRAVESDESGTVTAVYRVEDNALTIPLQRTSVLQRLINVFLPAGFPSSVTDDYVGYQIYDSLQAFSSSIAQLLTSRAVLQGFGVGDANASATSALLLTVLQDTAGRLATILFAHKFGTALEAECKTYRFAADIFNDLAMVMDCLSPLFVPAPLMRVGLLCLSGVLRALCGVAGGASKASLSVHFAKSGNVAELNAKASSKETVISLLGMLVGSFVVSQVTSPLSTWTLLILLLIVHLATNYKAVRCVSINTLNRQRISILFATFHNDSTILTPAQASAYERILTTGNTLRWGNEVIGTCEISTKFSALLYSVGRDTAGEFTVEVDRIPVSASTPETITSLATVLENENYLLWFSPPPESHSSFSFSRFGLRGKGIHPHITIVLKTSADTKDTIKAWIHALLVAVELTQLQKFVPEKPWWRLMAVEKIHIVEFTLRKVVIAWEEFVEGLEGAGWDLGTAAVETGVRWRVQMEREMEGREKGEGDGEGEGEMVVEKVGGEL
ncbi:DUF647-domain-containing protein [Ascodesmis nigricans]|uniref:DUF647-domain-containing protein n=1 Tax=Ascodesmis nigricans TaxID=341454 RepID=A0A4S2MUP8_9PEZI|nr:DUF647-domain-containing protein [Ascodesmis nigricans]